MTGMNGSLASALTGLTATARRAEVVSTNVANATTPGYGRRLLELSARSVGSTGQGVMVTGVTRVVDQRLIGERRLSQAEAGRMSTLAGFHAAVAGYLGSPDQPQSLNGRTDAFNTALLEATSHPESEARLTQVAVAAKALVGQISAISDQIQEQRAAADAQISAQVQQLNTALARVADLNVQIRSNIGSASDPSALFDQRQQLIDNIASIVPIREYDRGDGQIALMTTGGMMLVEGNATRFEFTPTGMVVPEMTLQGGSLSALSVNGRPIDTSSANSPIAGGSLAALFQIRDVEGVLQQSRIDAVARDLVERFQDPALDTTRAPGDPGLFTDNGAVFDPVNEIGLAQRLRLSLQVDPDAGGQLWRLRDGLGATAPGLAGNADLLNALESTMRAARNPVSGGFMLGARSFSQLSADLTSIVATARIGAESDETYATARADTMRSLELSRGVDTDQEMQDLLQIEQAYAANAKVLSTVDEMIKRLLEL